MRDNQPKHRQKRHRERKLQRQKASRLGLPSVLIVCEGRQTEPNYIRGLCAKLRINLAAVHIRSCGSETDALALVRLARTIFETDRDYDHVFVVCDDDGTDLGKARALSAQKLRRLDRKLTEIELIVSRPSFEFWLLLHFEYCARPLATAAEATSELKRYLTGYDKSDTNLFEQVSSGVELAVVRTAQLKQELRETDADKPDTDMPRLCQLLVTMVLPEP